MITQDRLNNEFEMLKRMVVNVPRPVVKQMIEEAKKTINDPKLAELEQLIN